MRRPTASYRAWATRMIDQWGSRAAELRRDPGSEHGAGIRAACLESIVADLRATLAGKSAPASHRQSVRTTQSDLFS